MDTALARARIAARSSLGAFISLSSEGGTGPVVGVKDLIDVRGLATTGGGPSAGLDPAGEDAPLVAAIRRAGGSVIGKTNLHEWAFGVNGANPFHGPVRNPRDPERDAGGSSGGSAAAVAAGMCDWAVGTDTAGSIRIPAAFCGVVGYKPTFGTIDTTGVIPLSRSLDTVGALAPSVREAAAAVATMTGGTPADEDGPAAPDELRVAVPDGWVHGLDPTTEAAWRRVAHSLPRTAMPEREVLYDLAGVIQGPEAAAAHRDRLARFPERYSPEVVAKLRAGLEVAAADYLAALEERERLRRAVDDALEPWGAVVLPACAIVAPPVGAPEQREPVLRFTRPLSLTGHPVVVIPVASPGLPVGVQVVGRFGGDRALLRVAEILERAWGPSPGPDAAPERP